MALSMLPPPSAACNRRAMQVNILWFRHGLRLHDNPALLAAMADAAAGVRLLPIFIFDGESAGTKSVGHNRMRFLLDSLRDIDEQLAERAAGRLLICKGKPVRIFQLLHDHPGMRIRKICVEQDCEPIWRERDEAVRSLCRTLGIQWVEKVSHTLWDPRTVIAKNGGIPPLTYQMFLHTVQIIGLPPRPVADPDWRGVSVCAPPEELRAALHAFPKVPAPEDLDVFPDSSAFVARTCWRGGERHALHALADRLKVERHAFQHGFYMPNQANPSIVEPSKSMSAHLRFGCLSVRRFYWNVHDLLRHVQLQQARANTGVHMATTGGAHITGQLIWREYFYTMSVNNPHYDRMEGNDICLSIPWSPPALDKLDAWRHGRTGYPLIDAAMRQLLAEGWLHHVLRNTVAIFLTRGGLWQSWEHGVQHFLKYLLDADWSVCAGNWMWVSSSAFEQMLDSSLISCPVAVSKRLDPHGTYICRYLPELSQVPKEYIHEPWRMPAEVQERSECILGVHYPERIIDWSEAAKRNRNAMRALRDTLIAQGAPTNGPPHCRSSNEAEIRQFFWLPTS